MKEYKISSPLISVNMVVYNVENYIKDAINSVLNQTFINFELIIINDASTDNTKQIINSIKDLRIKYYENENNMGPSYSRKIALNHSSGEYIAVLDGDDIMVETRLEKQFTYLETNHNVAVIGSYFTCINEIGKEIGSIKWPSGIDYNIYRSLYGETPVGNPGVLIRKDVIYKAGNFREKFEISEDVDLWLRIFSRGYFIDNISEYLTLYRIHSNSISSLNKKRLSKNHHLAFHDFYYSMTKISINHKIINRYLRILLDKNIIICAWDIKNIIKIFSTLHFALTNKLNIPLNTEYYYNQLGTDFGLDRYFIFKLFKMCIIYCPHIMVNIFRRI